jgi:uncharacterized membrane protein
MNTNFFNQAYKTTATIVFASIFSVLVISMLAFGLPLEAQQVSDEFLNLLWLLILMIAITVIFLRRFIFSEKRISVKAENNELAAIEALKFNTIFLVALADSISILGFLIVLLSGDKMSILRASAVSLLLLLIVFPRKSRWRNLIQKREFSSL